MKRFSVAILGLLVLGAALSWFLHFAPQRRERAREEALELARQGEFDKALRKLEGAGSDETTAAARARCLDALDRDRAEAGAIWSRLQNSTNPELRREALYRSGRHLALAGRPAEAEATLLKLLREDPEGPHSPSARYLLAEASRRQEKPGQAREEYKKSLEAGLTGPEAEAAREELGKINLGLLLEGSEEYTDSYRVLSGDTLGSIAGRFHTTVELLRKINDLSSDLLRLNQTLRIPSGDFSLVVSKQANRLTLLLDGEFFAAFPVGTGRNNCSPEGVFEITTKLVDPVWYSSEGEIPPGDPRNILGTRWLGFNDPYASYGIHGTTQPESIGTQSSSGCIRMNNRDAELLFILLPRGTRTTIVP